MAIQKDRFVNPYAFVPLATKAARRAAAPGHAGEKATERYSGHLSLSWKLATPLLLPANAAEEGWLRGKEVRVPGSSVAGAVRSLHEALFNGCFRVVDDAFLPGYREPATSDPTLTLGLITKAKDGRPLELRLCDDPVWVDSGDLLRRWPGGANPTTGDVLRFNGEIEDLEGLNRAQFATVDKVVLVRRADQHAESPASDVGARVIVVTSTSVRRKFKRDRRPGRALWAAGRLTDKLVPIDPTADAEMLANFRAASEGTDDRRRLEKDDPDGAWRTQTQYADVEWWADQAGRRMTVVGRRAKATGLLFVGDPVWVRYDAKANRVTEMKLASIWRRPGRGSVGSRLPEHLHPCDPGSPAGLCLSCATFGAADTNGEEKNRQVSYAGHVRFGAVRGTASRIERVDLAPLGAPRPGNGMFYLQGYQPRGSGRLTPGADPVATHWGSWAEGGTHPLSGRKFYWHSDPAKQAADLGAALGRPVPPRYQATAKQTSGKMSRPAQLVPAGTVLTSTVAFDQLDAVALHALLAALEPGRVLSVVPGREKSRFATHLGGGKPFGLGSVQVTIDPERSRITSLADRYGDAPTSQSDWLATPTPFPDLTRRVGDVATNLSALAAMLDLDALGADAAVVSYPPGATWDSYQAADQTRAEAFTASHVFFGKANGETMKTRDNPWHPLPAPTDQQRTLPIYPAGRP